MRWSWKVPTRFQLWKYTQENTGINRLSSRFFSFLTLLEKYLMFIEFVQSWQDLTKLKYLDESHFVCRQLSNGKVWGLKEKRIYTRENTLSEPSSSVTLILSLHPDQPLFYDFRIENNDQVSFFLSFFSIPFFFLIF